MHTQRTKLALPIEVTEGTFESLEHVADDIVRRGEKYFAEKNDLTSSDLQIIKSGDQIDRFDEWRNKSLKRDLERYRRLSFVIAFDDGSSVESTILDEIVKTLRQRSATVDKFNVDIGTFDTLSVQLHIFTGYRSRSVEWRIAGERADVRDANQMLMDIFKNSQPAHPWMHNRLFELITSSILVFMLYIFYSFLFKDIYIKAGTFWYFYKPMLLVVMSAVFASFFAASIAKAFPLVHFNFGRSSRLLSDRKAILAIVLTSIFIPLIVSIVIEPIFSH